MSLTPTPPTITLQLFLDSLIFPLKIFIVFGSFLLSKNQGPKNRESRNSCSVNNGDVGGKLEHMCWTDRHDSMDSFTGATTGFGGATAYYHPPQLFSVTNWFFAFRPDGQISLRPM